MVARLVRDAVLVSSLLLSACRGPSAGGQATPDACGPAQLGLGERARVISNWRVPDGCQVSGANGITPPHAIRSEDEFELSFRCTPKRASGIDFTKQDLWVSARMLSPAQTAVELVDDGKKVTLVSLFRSPCPADFPPMPSPYTVAFLLPRGSERAFAEASCTFPPKCGQ